LMFISISFLFQAEDGIRYFHVTGVQTCALPISVRRVRPRRRGRRDGPGLLADRPGTGPGGAHPLSPGTTNGGRCRAPTAVVHRRSEERRVGKEYSLRRFWGHKIIKQRKEYNGRN